ncbi:MAG: GTPase [Planctomycetota bacterium]
MLTPNPTDTIVAVATDWQPSAVGVVRLSGPESFVLAERLGVSPADAGRRSAGSASPRYPHWTHGWLALDERTRLPVTAFWFRGPHSYTGQDVVELHTVGCLPWLRELSARLIELGARRALPGEFTARGFLLGRLEADQVEGILDLMRASEAGSARRAARVARRSVQRDLAAAAERLTDLLARVEAGIDFVDEEDVRFVTPTEIVEWVDGILDVLKSLDRGVSDEHHAARPHVALVGLPNAGKSTLFNALLGHERALVSPVLGTTRDVLSAEVELAGVHVILQDCAGLGASTTELELATHQATEDASRQADLVLWVHATDMPWDERESVACAEIAPERRVLVLSKTDVRGPTAATYPRSTFAEVVELSAVCGMGLEHLREVVARRLRARPPTVPTTVGTGEVRAARAALQRARALAGDDSDRLSSPELLAVELRTAHGILAEQLSRPLDEELLQRIFGQFCVGK